MAVGTYEPAIEGEGGAGVQRFRIHRRVHEGEEGWDMLSGHKFVYIGRFTRRKKALVHVIRS